MGLLTPQILYEDKVYQAIKKYPNFLKLGEDGVVEIYADNHMLSSLRTCEGYFEESILNHITGKGRSWSLEFGLWWHKVMEYFYQAHKESWAGKWKYKQVAPVGDRTNIVIYDQNCVNFLQIAKQLWDVDYDLNAFEPFKQFKNLQGWMGAANLLLEYYNTHTGGQERLRIVGSELSFGRAKEVPIVLYPTFDIPFRAYLSGRIDLIVDDGSVIGPLDHKTTSYFDGTESDDFKPHEGMLGYVFALRYIMGEEFAKLGKQCNNIIINHICLKSQKTAQDRFKRSFKSYTPEEFAAYQQRMTRTFKKMYEIVCLGETPDWNTGVCTQMYYHDCPYKMLHELTPSARETVMAQFYTIKPAWSPYNEEK